MPESRSPTQYPGDGDRQAGRMPRTDSTASAPPHSERVKRDRDRAIDVARLSALLVVMFGHCALLLATVDDDGVHIGNLLGAVPAIAPVTWLVQIMPLFFLAGGAAGAYGWHQGSSWGTWLVTRAQRLCRPVFWYLAFWVAALMVARLILGPRSADALGRESVALLWFLGVYLVVLAFVPLLTQMRSWRTTALLVAGLLAAVLGIDAMRFAS
ncbi:MAG: acetyltransferase, partial [Mycobacterium sp.]|nr:acetyltransferase [Mycobacterium sp.]